MKTWSLLFLVALLIVGCQSGPKLSPEELQAKWRAPIVISAFNVGICEGATETAQKVQAEEIDGFAAFGELLGAGLMIQVVEESLAEAEPMEDQAALVTAMQSDMAALKGVLGPWIDKETTSTDVLKAISPVCEATNDTFEQVVAAASDDGMSPEAMDTILEEAADSMKSAVGDTE